MTHDKSADLVRRAEVLAILDGWIVQFGSVEINYTSARDYAVDAINDIRDLVIALRKEGEA